MLENSAPPSSSTTQSMQQDESFLNLLNSQRELLHKLKMENALRLEQSSSWGATTHPAWTNYPIADRGGSDLSVIKRLSLSLGFNFDIMPLLKPDESVQIDPNMHDRLDVMDHTVMKRKKRRLSSLGFLSASFFDDHLKVESRRTSFLLTTVKPEDEHVEHVTVDRDADSDDEEAIKLTVPANIDEPLSIDQFLQPCSPEPVHPFHTKFFVQAFTSAMEKSQKSQQDIHNWDRKMGLKRSHSKTMRQSSRSRKKLKTVLKKEIATFATDM
jgi:hypothetical protein